MSTGIGALTVFLPTLFDGPSPVYPNPTDALGFGRLFVVAGAGLASGGLLVGPARLGRAVSDRVRRN